jgi:hypothetical protein
MHSTHQKEVLIMNIEKINKLYENMISLQELFEEEQNPVDAINGLRFASAEFRHAFIKVRETLLRSPVSKQTQIQTAEKNVKAKEMAAFTQKLIDEGYTKEDSSSKPSSKKTEKKDTTTKTTATPKKKEKDSLEDKFDEFILDSYDESSHDQSTDIDDIIRMFSLYIGKQANLVYPRFRKYLRSIYNTTDGDKIHLKPKSYGLPNEGNFDASGLNFYQHPKFKYLWCREDGTFFYLLPDGKTIKENPIIKNPRTMYLSVLGGRSNLSARLLALECYMHREIEGHHVSVLNGDKTDLSYSNLSIRTMRGFKAPNNQYDEADAVAACEYIVAHGKDITNIEADTNYQIGYGFARSILEKKRFERISNKYF